MHALQLARQYVVPQGWSWTIWGYILGVFINVVVVLSTDINQPVTIYLIPGTLIGAGLAFSRANILSKIW